MRIKYMNQLVVFRHVKIRWRLKNLVTVSHFVGRVRKFSESALRHHPLVFKLSGLTDQSVPVQHLGYSASHARVR